MRKAFIIENLSEMESLAKALSRHLFPGFVLCLEGDLGAGKTTFTKFLGKHMGITDTINSPTFTILKIYEHELPLYHMDVYRLQGIGADYDLEEYIYDDGVCVIEWYQHIIESLPEDFLAMTITIANNKRRVILEGSGEYEHIISSIDY
ncbi:MAG: tRNA (adenosine(37)-N6)-threonylcarbamoyltransferase complex ATPase subunit type 1 TsaE [Candidatus Izemoplasma sp.]|nr:tRNA (adenosine(37)-N6)-threonylcarbamoyltransferase complex ATPase subunit type 1 TsaE [Candidatus Izemoplasma sp.]